ncbi:MAG: prepilin-type N-terminal cleavage/methylation domain-containing protein [Pseudomonadota bacterium]
MSESKSPQTNRGMTMREAMLVLVEREREADDLDLFNLRAHWERQHTTRDTDCEPVLDLNDTKLAEEVSLQIMHKNLGVTLIETLIGIVIMSVSFTAIASLMTNTVLSSAKPVIYEQAISIAESHLETILLQPYDDPNETEMNTCEEGDGSFRHLYDDVSDYQCILDTDGARDATGNLIPGLGAYNVDINMQSTTLNGAPAYEIDIVVTHDATPDVEIALRGYRVDYE